MNLPSAYQGRGWKPRRLPMRAERDGRLWSQHAISSEYKSLKSVLLFSPGREVHGLRQPQRIQHLRKIDSRKLRRELNAYAKALRQCGIEVNWVQAKAPPPNFVFQRDLFFNTPEGVILGRMASEVRAGEEKFAAASLAAHSLPILATISGRGTFEGADALWLTPRFVLVGVGNRTNREGFAQVRRVLGQQGVKAAAVKMPAGVQHLLGILQIVDRRLAVVRGAKMSRTLKSFLRRQGFRLLEVPETEEVCEHQGLNFVTVAPREIVMAANCPELRALLTANKIKIRNELEIPQLLNAAGGLACATGILARSP